MKLLLPMAVLVLATSAAAADQRYDHRGSIGLLLAGDVERKDAVEVSGASDSGWRGGAEVGGTFSVGSDSNELKASVRLLFGGALDFALFVGYRGYFDLGQWKTFFELDLAPHFTPVFTIGPRFAVGVQLDFLPVAGAFAVLGGQVGFGNGIRYGAELGLGFQLRTYLYD